MYAEWPYEGDRTCKSVGIDGNRSRYPAERMLVRVKVGAVCAKLGGTAGVSSCPMEMIPCDKAFFIDKF